MTQFKISVIINKPIETVYSAFINADNMLKWTKDLEEIEIVKGEFGEIGATMHLHYNQKGRKSVLEDKLEYLAPNKKIKSRITGGGLIAFVETEFCSTLKETEITMCWNGKGNTIFVTFILAILKKKIKKVALTELNKFKSLVEEFGVNFC